MLSTTLQRSRFKAQFCDINDDPDFTIRIEDYEWRVHSEIISASSGFFKKLFESKFKEANENFVILHDDEPDLVARMIQYMYCGVYQDHILDNPDQEPVLQEVPSLSDMLSLGDQHGFDEVPDREVDEVRVMMYFIGDKYEVKTLVDKNLQELGDSIRFEAWNFVHIFDHIEIHSLEVHSQLWKVLLTALAERLVLHPRAAAIHSPHSVYEEIDDYTDEHKQIIESDPHIKEMMFDCLIEAARDKAHQLSAQKDSQSSRCVPLGLNADRRC